MQSLLKANNITNLRRFYKSKNIIHFILVNWNMNNNITIIIYTHMLDEKPCFLHLSILLSSLCQISFFLLPTHPKRSIIFCKNSKNYHCHWISLGPSFPMSFTMLLTWMIPAFSIASGAITTIVAAGLARPVLWRQTLELACSSKRTLLSVLHFH